MQLRPEKIEHESDCSSVQACERPAPCSAQSVASSFDAAQRARKLAVARRSALLSKHGYTSHEMNFGDTPTTSVTNQLPTRTHTPYLLRDAVAHARVIALNTKQQ